ncbi:hypothetical protein SAMD00024442_129_2 [Candidatus Symbiothrix dinenymphae]|nr:hypothetical protein SAMD00024442_129_2 [Candidatus Symbiothrix dinenymphae]
MNKKVFFMSAFMASVTLTQAQTVLTPHFTDASKKIVVPKDAQVNPEIHDGLIAIYAGGMLYADTTGKYVVGTNFPVSVNTMHYSGYFSGGAAMVQRKKPNASSASACIIYPDGKYRDVPTVKPQNWVMGSYDVLTASDFCDGYAVVTKGTFMSFNQVFIDKNGKEVFPALTSKGKGSMGDANIYPVRENRRVYYNAELKKYGYADEKGNVVIKPQFNKAQAFSEGLAAVMLEENYAQKWGFIDPTGKMVIPATYNLKPGRFSEGLAAVRIGSESEYEMAYIDKTGKRVIENKKWNLNEFHNGYAWVGTGCDKLFVWNTKFEEVRDVTKDFEHGGSGFGTCNFQMYSGTDTDRDWGFDFPNGMQSLNQDGVKAGDIFAPDGTIVFKGKDAKDEISLYNVTEGGLIFCNAWLSDARLKEEGVTPCFINQKGEIVFYFQESVEGFEGPAPVEAKATPAATAKPAAKKAPAKK